MKKTMMNNIFKRFAALALCTGMVTGTALAANTVYKNIRVQYCGIKLVVNGAPVTPKDANGSTVEPFIYNGTCRYAQWAMHSVRTFRGTAALRPFTLV